MKKRFSSAWVSSKAPRKQRKYRYNAPLHVRGDFINAMLSDQLSEKHKVSKLRIRVGDKVKVMRGKFKGTEGKVELLDMKKSRAKITGIEVSKKDGSKAKVPVHVSNLVIVEINNDDKKRLNSKSTTTSKTKKVE